jgi:hypothetical protein
MPKYEAFINLFVLYDYFLPSIPIFILLVFFQNSVIIWDIWIYYFIYSCIYFIIFFLYKF